MRRNVRRHAHRDAAGAIGQQVRKLRGQHDRLAQRTVIVVAEIYSVLVQTLKQRLGHDGHPRLGIARGRRVVAVDIAEVPLPIDQRVADVEILRQTRHRIVDRGIAVRVIVTHHVARNLGRLAESTGRAESQFPHGIQDSPVYRLQPVARIGQSPVHDGGQRIGQVAFANRAAQRFGHLAPIVRGLHVGVVDRIVHT